MLPIIIIITATTTSVPSYTVTTRVSPTLVTIDAGTYGCTSTSSENFHNLLLGIIHVNKTTNWSHQTSSGQWRQKPRPNELRKRQTGSRALWCSIPPQSWPRPALPPYILHLMPDARTWPQKTKLATKQDPKRSWGMGRGKGCKGRPLEKSLFFHTWKKTTCRILTQNIISARPSLSIPRVQITIKGQDF